MPTPPPNSRLSEQTGRPYHEHDRHQHTGHHAEIDRWRRREALKRTIERRPDLIGEPDALEPEDRALLKELLEQGEKGALE